MMPVPSDAASDLIARSRAYTPERRLWVVAIGCLTDIASALIIPAGCVIDQAGPVEFFYAGGNCRCIKLPPALIERRPENNGCDASQMFDRIPDFPQPDFSAEL